MPSSAADLPRVRTVSRPSPRGTRTIVALVIVLAAVVAAASNGTSIWVPPRTGWADRTELILIAVAILAAGAAVAAVVAFALHRTVHLRRPDPPQLRSTMMRAVPFTAVAVAMVGLLTIARMPLAREAPGVTSAGDGNRQGVPLLFRGSWETLAEAGGGTDEEPNGPDPDPMARAPLLILLFGAIVAVTGGTAWWYRRRSRSAAGADGELGQHRAVAQAAVLGTIDAMLADPDPRTAVIGAYARLLEGLAACGTPRRDYEGPAGHLRRVLSALRVRPEPLRRLIELFEVARFSTHLLTPAHRDQALGALRAVAGDLGGFSAPAPFPVASSPKGTLA
jgi:hypothetical protein